MPFETALPVSSNTRQRITCTGHSNVIRAAGGKCKKVFIQAKATSSGASLTGNTDMILLGVGSDPGTTTAFNGLMLAAGVMLTLEIDDLSQLYFRGANGEEVFLTPVL